ncbi:MAG: hypothetical protein M1831_006400 [Alyxoria varia]|nr:MAG: hypothetical protein M1831_006400 [Alyxoria varia]
MTQGYMSSNVFAEEPQSSRTQSLSPVSPKPIHYPSPSSIPVLENQMDPVFNDTSTHTNLPESSQPNRRNQDASAQQPTTTEVEHSEQNQADEISHTSNGLDKIASTGTKDASAIDPSNPPSTDVQTSQPQALPNPLNETVDTAAASAVNFQELLNNLAAPASASTAPDSYGLTAPTTYSNEPNAPGSLLPSVSTTTKPQDDSPTPSFPYGANLPPRPPQLSTSNQSTETENNAASSHDQASSGSPSQAPPPGMTQWQAPGNLPPLLTAGAPGTSVSTANGLPPPPVATFQQLSQSQPNSATAGHAPVEGAGDLENDDMAEGEDIPWGSEVQKLYDEFLEAERKYVLEGKWDRFPLGSRLFIGNLPTEKVTKRDLYHVFYKHGKLAQISIKQAYGFVQFLTAEDCARALKLEEGVEVRGKKIHLEISKPQRNTKSSNNNNDGRGSRNRRSRSPEMNRSGNNNSKGGDRYRDRGGNNRRDGHRQHDAYRPGRSPSPRRRRSPDRNYGRRRSRSPGKRTRSPNRSNDDDLPLPRRYGKNVPDVQIIATSALDRSFINQVKTTFEARGLIVDVLLLGQQLSETAVMRRQILEGVHAVMKLSHQHFRNQKYQLSVFDRSAGNQNVRFDEYQDQDLSICVELVARAKQQAKGLQGYGYGTSQYGLPIAPDNVPQPPAFPQTMPQPSRHQLPPPLPSFNPTPQHPQYSQQSPTTAGNNDISSTINNMDTASLQQLLGSLQQNSPTSVTPQSSGFPSQQQQHYSQPSSAGATDPNNLARLLNSAGQSQPPTPSYQTHQQSPTSYYGSQHHAQPQQPFSPQNHSGAGFPQQRLGSASLPPPPHQQQHQSQGGWSFPHQQQQPAQQQQPHSQGYGAGLQAQQQTPAPAPGGPDMQNIMAQLARYGR